MLEALQTDLRRFKNFMGYAKNFINKTNFVPIMILSEQNGKTVVEKNYFYDREGQRIDTVKNYDEIVKSGNR